MHCSIYSQENVYQGQSRIGESFINIHLIFPKCVMLPCHADSETLGAQKMRKQKRPQTSRESSFKQQVQYKWIQCPDIKSAQDATIPAFVRHL